MPIVYLGIGSNLGKRETNIEKAIQLFKKNHIDILKTSTFIETDPVGGPPQGKFLNGVIKIKTLLSPQELLKILKDIEKQLGRTKTVIDGPRTIDLDILVYDQIKIKTPELTIPHPRMLEREFVLKPLQEIAPQLLKELHAHR